MHLRFQFTLSVVFFSLLAVAALSFGQGPSSDNDAKLEELSAQAQSAQQRGDYASAAAAYEQLAQLRPDLGEIWANAGLMHQFMGDYRKADQEFQTALKKNSKLYVPNLFLGLNRLRDRQPRAALPFLKSAVLLNRDDEQAALGLGRAYAGLRNYRDASRWFEDARQINPQDANAWYELGVSYLNLQDAAAAQLKKLDPEDVHARTLVADAFVEQGRTKDAIQIYEKFRTREDPPCLHSELGFAYLQVGEIDQAKDAFREDITHRSGCLLANLGLARQAMAANDFVELLHQLHEVEQRDPNFLHTYLPRIWSGLDADQLKTVTAELQKPEYQQDSIARLAIDSASTGSPTSQAGDTALEHSPEDRSASNVPPEQLWTEGRYSTCAEKIEELKTARPAAFTGLLMRCSFFAGKYRLALEASQQALDIAPRNLEALYWQAKSAQELSVSSFAQMNAVAPNSPKVHLLMAELHRTREDYAAAETEYNEILKTGSSDEALSAHLGLAQIHFRNLEDDQAIEDLQPVLKSDSANADANSLLGQLLVRRQEYDAAIPHLKLGLQGGSPSSLPELHSLLAKCHSARGEYTQALAELKPALPADTMGTYHYQLYQVYQKLGDTKSAAAALQKSEQLRAGKASAEQHHMESGH